MSSLGEQKENLERLLESCEDEKLHLAEQNSKLTASGKLFLQFFLTAIVALERCC